MRKKRLLPRIVAILIAAAAVFAVWYCSPTALLGRHSPTDVASISVFDGSNGKQFHITDADEIRTVVESVQRAALRVDGISLGRMGYVFRLQFCNAAGKPLAGFIINSADTLRKDPFFYRCGGELCFDYLKELEHKYAN